ncbi:MAG: GNVR domain-containing protein [Candidatus Eisenbacteria bacterium]
MSDGNDRRRGFSLLDGMETLFRHRRMIATNVGIVVVAAVIVSLLLPQWYQSTAVILPPETSVDPLTTLGALQMAAATAKLPWFATASDVYGAVLRSRFISEAIIERFDLMTLYDVDNLDEAVKEHRRHRTIKVSDEGLVEVIVEDRDPVRAAEMANDYLGILDEFNQNTRMTEGKRTLRFVEERLRVTEGQVVAAESALRDFQKEHGAIELTAQAEALITAAAEIESEIRTIEIKLAALESFATGAYPEVRVLRAQKENLEGQLTQLLGDTDLVRAFLDSGDSKPYPSLNRLPDLAIEYMSLRRDVEIQSKIQVFLAQELERAKIMATRDTPTIQLLDRATPPEKRHRPRRTLIVAASFILALVGSVTIAFGLDAVDSWKGDGDNHRRLDHMVQTLRGEWRLPRGNRASRS